MLPLLSAQLAQATNIGNVTIFANSLIYKQEDGVFYAKGNVTLINKDYTASADQMTYKASEDSLFVKGGLIIFDRYGNVITGDEMILQNQFKDLILSNAVAKLANQASTITASKISKLDNYELNMDDVCYTACLTSEFKNPIWQVRAKRASINRKTEATEYRNVVFEVFGVPIIFLPYFSRSLPKAKAKSGILAPYLDTKNLKLPIYFRAKSNLDFTVTPRFANGQVITEGEIRHLTTKGQYLLNGSLASVESIKRNDSGVLIKDNYLNQYYFSGDGNFKFDNFATGFNLKKTTSPAYLNKYHNIYDPYLSSNIYLQNVSYANYSRAEILYFQDMRSHKMFARDLFAAPLIKTKRLYSLDDKSYLSIDSNNIFYRSGNQYQVWRSSNIFNLSKTFELQNHIFDMNLYNKINLYKFNSNVRGPVSDSKTNTNFTKNTPEVYAYWRYPIITNTALIIEPVALISTHLAQPRSKNLLPIDSELEFETDELNLMSHNRFSGRDRDENGCRASYGVNLQKIDYMTYSVFLGKNSSKLSKNNTVGNISASSQDAEFYYRFNLSGNFNINMHELGSRYTSDKIDFFASLFEKNSEEGPGAHSLKKISNLISKIRYNFNENWSMNLDTIVDLSSHPSTLIRGFGVTYQYDCVRMSVRIFDNFTQDLTRNIKKSKNNVSFKIGLKTLNM
jgi:LPS-assembly protein